MKNRIRTICVLLAVAALALSGCQTARFYGQAIAGQCRILCSQKKVTTLINEPGTSAFLKGKLEEVLKIREFAARELHLPVDGHYLKYVDLHRPFVVWNVYAAPEFSLAPKTWWFPIVGRASYRGYFSEKAARSYAATLNKKGYDVFVGGVETYSTLGWFRDPLLNTFIDEPDADLAEIIFHELAHQRLFIAGDTDFNEAFATAVAEEGLRRWFSAERKPDAYKRYLEEIEHKEQFIKLVMGGIARLEAVYNDPHLDDAAKRARKQEVIAELRAGHEKLKAEWGGKSPYDAWFAKEINNAKLSTLATYYELVPAFHAMLHANGDDLEKFYAAVKKLSKVPQQERRRVLIGYEERDRAAAERNL